MGTQGEDSNDQSGREDRDLTATPPRDQASALERPEPILGVSCHRGSVRLLRSVQMDAT